MKRKRVAVQCLGLRCTWSGRKVFLGTECECEYPCSHSPYSPCPKCGGRVYDREYARRLAEFDKMPERATGIEPV